MKTKLIIPLLFLFSPLIFNWFVIPEIFNKDLFHSYGEDTIPLQYFAEIFKDRLLHFQSPLSPIPQLMYPFGANPIVGEVGPLHGLYFIFLRLFLTPHGSFNALILINTFLAEICMYLLLRTLKIKSPISALIAISFAFTPFISFPRLTQHYTYLHHYFFPLTTLFIVKALQTKKNLYAIVAGFFWGLMVYVTLYYFIMYGIMLFIFIIIYLLLNKNFKLKIKNYLPTTGYFLLVTFLTILPLLLPSYYLIKNNLYPKTVFDTGFAKYSATFHALFLPSPNNPFYKTLTQNLKPFQPLEAVIYPGLISFLGLFIFIKKLIYKKDYSLLPIHYSLILTTIFMFLLCLGPYLQIVDLQANPPIRQVLPIPLPYLLLTKIPVINGMRAPARFALPLAFTLLILTAYMLNDIKLKNKKDYSLFLIPLFLIVFLDQSYTRHQDNTPTTLVTPSTSLTNIIKSEKETSAVLTLPTQIRDGIHWYGDKQAYLPFTVSQLTNKPTFGGYLARVDDSQFAFTENCQLLNYAFKLSDYREELGILTPSLTARLKKQADFLDFKYILAQNNLPEKENVNYNLSQIGYTPISTDSAFTLYSLPLAHTPTREINLLESNNCNLYGRWSEPLNAFRWINSKYPQVGVFIKSDKAGPTTLTLNAISRTGTIKLSIYDQRSKIKDLSISPTPRDHSVNIQVVKGLNLILFQLSSPLPQIPSYLVGISKITVN